MCEAVLTVTLLSALDVFSRLFDCAISRELTPDATPNLSEIFRNTLRGKLCGRGNSNTFPIKAIQWEMQSTGVRLPSPVWPRQTIQGLIVFPDLSLNVIKTEVFTEKVLVQRDGEKSGDPYLWRSVTSE